MTKNGLPLPRRRFKVTIPSVVIAAIRAGMIRPPAPICLRLTYQSLPSLPAAIATGVSIPAGYSMITPVVESRAAIWLAPCSSIQTRPSEPTTSPSGPANGVGSGYSVIAPDVVMLDTAFAPVNQSLSGPAARSLRARCEGTR